MLRRKIKSPRSRFKSLAHHYLSQQKAWGGTLCLAGLLWVTPSAPAEIPITHVHLLGASPTTFTPPSHWRLVYCESMDECINPATGLRETDCIGTQVCLYVTDDSELCLGATVAEIESRLHVVMTHRDVRDFPTICVGSNPCGNSIMYSLAYANTNLLKGPTQFFQLGPYPPGSEEYHAHRGSLEVIVSALLPCFTDNIDPCGLATRVEFLPVYFTTKDCCPLDQYYNPILEACDEWRTSGGGATPHQHQRQQQRRHRLRRRLLHQRRH